MGEWIPEPLPENSEFVSSDPADRITLDESINMAFLVVLESMTPAERVAFILHDVFRYPFAEVAEIVGRTPGACRQRPDQADLGGAKPREAAILGQPLNHVDLVRPENGWSDRGTGSYRAAVSIEARGFIRSHQAFARLWTARTISFLGDSVGLVALLLYVQTDTGSAVAVAMLMLVGDFAPQLLSPIAGAIADRLDRRLVMVTCEVGQALLVLTIALTLPPLPVLLSLVAVRSLLATVFQPASGAAVPGLVADEHLPRANSLIGAGTHGLDVLGPLVAAALLPLLHIPGLLVFDAATFAVSAALLMTLPRLPRPARAAGAAPTTVLGEAAEGLRYLWQHKVIRVVTLGFCAVVAFNGVDDVALVFLAKDALHQGDSAASALYAGAGAGMLVGFAVLARWSGRVPVVVLLLVGYAVSSLGNLLTGLAWAIVAALGMQFIRGAGIAAMDTGHHTLIQRVVPEPLLGRVFGNLYGAVGMAAGLSYVVGGLVLDATGPRLVLIVAGAGGLIVAGVVATLLPRHLRALGERST